MCGVRSDPLPHNIAFDEQYLSHPQQMRSGWAGTMGNNLAIRYVVALGVGRREKISAPAFFVEEIGRHKSEGLNPCLGFDSLNCHRRPYTTREKRRRSLLACR